MNNFEKILSIGKTRDCGTLYAKVEFKNDAPGERFKGGRLSITGVEGPMRNGDARGSCGQIVMGEWDIVEYAPGWDADAVKAFRNIWNRWHLNDMTAGSPDQEAFLRANPVTAVYPESHYTKACKVLEAAGLNPDPNYLYKGAPYKYGNAWLYEEVPVEVLEWLKGLPDATSTPAWI